MNIPNTLTVFRFLLIPAFIYAFFNDKNGDIRVATYIFLLAGITDVLDGYIARKYNLITKWGQAMDPVADKAMQLTVLLCFTIKEYLPVWVISIIGVKEILMIIGGIFLYIRRGKVVIPANKYGKIATIAFYVAIIYTVLNLPYKTFVIVIAIFLTLMAFGNYFKIFRAVKEKNV